MSFHHSPKIITDGLLFYLDPGNSKYTSTNTLTDAAGNGWDFTRVYTSGRDENLVIEDGAMIFTPNPPVTPAPENSSIDGNWMRRNEMQEWGSNDFTWMAWHYCYALGTYQGQSWPKCLIDWSTLGNRRCDFELTTSGRLRLTNRTDAGYETFTDNTFTIEENQWYCSAFVRNGDNWTFYNNGVKGTTINNSYSIILFGSYTNIGRSPDDDYHWKTYVGKIGPVTTYTRALSAAEIKQNYDGLKGRFGL